MSRSLEYCIPIEDQDEENIADPNIIATLQHEKVAPSYERLKKSLAETKRYTEEYIKRADAERAKEKPRIQRVPVVLKEQKKFEKHYEQPWMEQKRLERYYEPRWISVGPIHHGKSKLIPAENNYKPKLVAKFINDSGSGFEAFYKIIKDRIEELKKCFDEDVIKDYDDNVLSWMLFFDGCSTLQFISSYVKGAEELKLFSIKNEQIAYAQQDLFLLENQIPFLVLKLLMERRKDVDELKKSMKEFIRRNVMTPEKYKNKIAVATDPEPTHDLLENKIAIATDPEPTHLLELLRLAILQKPGRHRTSCGSLVGMLSSPLNKVSFPFKNHCKKLFEDSKGKGLQSFRSVQDLKSAGIDLKPSETCSFIDISFTSLCFAGRLRLPPITVDDSTASRFLNLIAFEMCPDNFRTNYEVTSYISFLDSLIDYPSDVKELRSSHILHNLLGCDKDVALLFNEIGTDLVPSPVYQDVIVRIQNHYRSKWRTSMAEVYHDHFRSPWTIVAFLAATAALGMSGIQTWYTIRS